MKIVTLIIGVLVIAAIAMWLLLAYAVRRITSKEEEYKRKLIAELDLLLSTHLKVEYDEFFKMVNRKFPHKFVINTNRPYAYDEESIEHLICVACDRIGGDRIHNTTRELIIEFSDMTIPELEQVLQKYSVMKLAQPRKE